MALLFMDGFDHYATADITQKWTQINGTPAIAASGRTGNAAVLNAADEYIGVSCLPSIATAIVGFAYKTTGLPPSSRVLAMMGSSTQWECGVLLNADGTITAGRANSVNAKPGSNSYVTVVSTVASSAVIQENIWYYIEVKFVLDNSVGSVTARVNGVDSGMVAGNVDTVLTSTTGTRIGLGFGGDVGTTSYFDDVYIASTSGGTVSDFLGDVTCEALLPQTDAVAPGSNAGWTCSSGSPEDHGDEVNDATPDGDSTYVYASTNVKDTWNYPDLSVANATIHGVQVSTSAKKSATGTTEFKNLARVTGGGGDHQGANTHAPSDTSYAYYRDIWETNPDDSSPWTPSDISGAEFGVERTA